MAKWICGNRILVDEKSLEDIREIVLPELDNIKKIIDKHREEIDRKDFRFINAVRSDTDKLHYLPAMFMLLDIDYLPYCFIITHTTIWYNWGVQAIRIPDNVLVAENAFGQVLGDRVIDLYFPDSFNKGNLSALSMIIAESYNYVIHSNNPRWLKSKRFKVVPNKENN